MSSNSIYHGPRVRDTHTFIQKASYVHSCYYGYDNVDYRNAVDKISITCPVHGDFEQSPNEHLRGRGCKQCALNRRKNSLPEVIEKFREVHGDLYSYENIKYEGYHKKVEIICKNHGSFKQTPANHISGYGCRKCGINQASSSRTKDNKWFISKIREIHGDKYLFHATNYIGRHKKVTITCRIHGDQEVVAGNLLNGQGGCWGCRNDRISETGKFRNQITDENKNEDCVFYAVVILVNGVKVEKVGITRKTVEERFRYENVELMEVLFLKSGTFQDCLQLEQECLSTLHEERYRVPKELYRSFSGWTECFKVGTVSMNEIIESDKSLSS